MLNNYTPLLAKYQELWEKYSNSDVKPEGFIPTPCLASQEESVKWSLELKKALETLAAENKVSYNRLLNAFNSGASYEHDNPKLTKTHLGLARINYLLRAAKDKQLTDEDYSKAEALVDRFGLFFNFASVDELFLSTQTDVSSVIDFV